MTHLFFRGNPMLGLPWYQAPERQLRVNLFTGKQKVMPRQLAQIISSFSCLVTILGFLHGQFLQNAHWLQMFQSLYTLSLHPGRYQATTVKIYLKKPTPWQTGHLPLILERPLIGSILHYKIMTQHEYMYLVLFGSQINNGYHMPFSQSDLGIWKLRPIIWSAIFIPFHIFQVPWRDFCRRGV